MSTAWVRELVGLNFLALADVVIDIRQESQLVGSRVTIPLYQQLVKFHDLLPANTSGMIDRACELRWKAVKLLESRGAVSDVDADVANHRWETSITMTINRPFVAVVNAVDREAKRRATATTANTALGREADAAPTEREVAALPTPEKVTLPWLVRHVSVQLWISAAAVILATFMLGLRASELSFFRQIAGLKASSEAPPSTKRLQRPERGAPVLPRGTRIVLHVRVGDTSTTPDEIKEWLIASGYAVPGVRRVDVDNAPSVVSEVRFFHESDRRGADSLVQALRDWGYPHVDRRYTPGFEARVRPGQYEIWFVQP